jgi:transposase
MATITTIGLKIANQLFKCTGVTMVAKWLSAGSWSVVIFWHSFQKLPQYLIGIEACASAHHWSRELEALGDTVRLMPPAYLF